MVIVIIAKVLMIYICFFWSDRQDNVLKLQNHATVSNASSGQAESLAINEMKLFSMGSRQGQFAPTFHCLPYSTVSTSKIKNR